MSHLIIDIEDSGTESDNRDLYETVISTGGHEITVNPVQLFLNAVENIDETGSWVLTFKHLIDVMYNGADPVI